MDQVFRARTHTDILVLLHTKVGGSVNGFPWPRLTPTTSAASAAVQLRRLGIEPEFWIGWSEVGLAVASVVSAARPGARLTLKQKFGTLRYTVSGGTDLSFLDITARALREVIESSASSTCETCGRPGRRHVEPVGVWCDACRYLRDTGSIALPFPPRLPLIDDQAAEAHRFLSANASLPAIPIGWSRLVASTLRDLNDVAPTTRFRLWVRGDAVSLVPLEGAFPAEVEALSERLVVNSRARCQHCSRPIPDGRTDRAGICAGCLWVQSLGWDVIPADEPWEPEPPDGAIS
ncbi:hypothetical protein [Leifsonia shinshuensis]|uniref:Uncharacterized protein n=1 Tax=Leifsonia shinshuensis TaxID=150026 RepID=A0A7G6YA48_9MICO|nr:hypothetical protein [Leifsonia shinshuensis]QNE35363.1 hypothetical protein F1C12_09635 [Leifsonia shinshuensis]